MLSHILPADEVDFEAMVQSYLTHATPTTELQELVSAMIRPMKTQPVYFDFYDVKTYLAIIQKWVRTIGLLYYTLSTT